MAEPIVFQHAVEGLIRTLGRPLEREVEERFQAAGVSVERVLPAYPYTTWIRMLEIVADVHSPGAPREQAMFALGQRFLLAFGDTVMGKALLTALAIMGPKRALEQLTRSFRTANNFSETRVVPLGPNHWDVWCSHVAHPDWYRGLLTAGLLQAGAHWVEVTTRYHDEAGATFEVRYRDR